MSAPLGLYTAVENIDKDFLKSRFGVKKSEPGALFKPSTRALFEYLGDDWAKYERRYAPAFEIGDADKSRVIAFAKLVSTADDKAFAAQLPGYLDLDEAARFLAVTVWLSSLDSILEMGHNYYLYLEPKTGRFLLLPWDLDHSFGQWMRADTASLSITQPWSGENRFLQRLFATPAFRSKYDAYIADFGKTLFTPAAIAARMKRLDRVVRPAIAAESPETLRRYEAAVNEPQAGEAGKKAAASAVVARGRPGPGAGDPILTFMKKRAASVQAQLAGQVAPAASSARGGPPGPHESPADLLADCLLPVMDADKDSCVTRAEAQSAGRRWSAEWDGDKDGALSEAELATGLRKLLPLRLRRIGGHDAGPPPDGFGPPPFGPEPGEADDHE